MLAGNVMRGRLTGVVGINHMQGERDNGGGRGEADVGDPWAPRAGMNGGKSKVVTGGEDTPGMGR